MSENNNLDSNNKDISYNDHNPVNENLEFIKDLRNKAQEFIKDDNTDLESYDKKELKELIYELKVYHIELQMQNEELKRNQEELRLSNDKYSELYEFSPISYYTLNEKGIIQETNLAGSKLIGLDRSLLINNSFITYIYPDNVNKFKDHIKLTLNSELKETTYISLNVKDDKKKYVRIESIKIKKEGSIKILTAVIDLTQKKEAEDKSRESEKKYKSLFENMLNGFAYFKVIYNKDNNPKDFLYMEINDAFEIITGINRREVLGKNASKVTPNIFGDNFDWVNAFGSISLREENLRIEVYSVLHKRWFSIYAYTPQKNYFAIMLEDISQRKKIEDNLRSSEERYRAVVEDQTELIRRFRYDGIITFVNEAYSRYFQKSREELVNDSYLSYVMVEDRPELQELIQSLTTENPIISYEHRIIFESGEITWVRWNFRAIFDNEGNIIEYQSVGRDISQQKEAEEALRKSEEKYRTLLQSITGGVTVLNNDWDIVLVNDEMLKLADKCCDGNREENLTKILGLKSSDMFSIYENVIKNEKPEIIINKIVSEKEYDLWIENNIYPFPEGIMCISSDITERKKIEVELKESEEKYKKFIELANDAIFMADAETGIIVEANKEAEKLLKRPMKEIIGIHQSKLHNPDKNDNSETIEFKKTVSGKKAKYTETNIINSDGKLIPVEISGTTINLRGKKYVLGIFRDISLRKQEEKKMKEIYSQLEKSSKQLSKVNLDIKEANEELNNKNKELISINNELERIKNNLEAVVNNFPNGIIVLYNKEQDIILARGKGLTQLSLDHNHLEGKKIHEIDNFDKEKIDIAIELFSKSIKGETKEIEIKLHNFDYTVKSLPIKDNHHNIIGGLCIIEDVTKEKLITKELKQTNKQLNQALRQVKESELKYRAIVEDQTELICRLNNNLNITFSNEAFRRYFDIKDKNNINLSFFTKIITQKDIQSIIDLMKTLDSKNPINFIEHKINMGDNIKWCRWTFRAILDDNDSIIQYQAVGKDITNEKNACFELEKSQKRFKAIFDNAIVGVNVVNKDGDYIQFNEKWAKMIGYSMDEVYKLNRFDITYEKDKTKCSNLMKLLMNKEIDSYHIEKRFIRKDGSIFWGELSTSPIYDEYGNIDIIIGIVTDISDRKKSEEALKDTMEELKRSNEELENFAHTVSHDLKSPVNVVISYINLLKRNYAEAMGKDGMELTDMVMERSRKMIGMIDNLLAYSQINSSNKTFVECDTNKIVENAIKNIEFDIKETNTKIIYDILPNVTGDETQLISVFQNIISNSIKYKKEGRKPYIKINFTDKDNQWLFIISDNGVGIEHEELDKIFNIFHRAKKTKKFSGYGIGLSTAKKIIERHGGKIWIESEPNEGTNVFFTISK